jgi:hypothetical protein
MLFILRQLRRIELRKRSGQYFLYAFGEIVLIVVGILIAVQINNWNERRIQSNEDKHLTTVLRTELRDVHVYNKKILEQLTAQQELLQSYIGSNDKEELEVLLEEMDKHEVVRFFSFHGLLTVVTLFYDPRTNNYDSILSNGSISIITDRDLVNLLGVIYVQRKSIMEGLLDREISNVESLQSYLASQYPEYILKLNKAHYSEDWPKNNMDYLLAYQNDGTAIGLMKHRSGLIASRRGVLQGIVQNTEEYLNSIQDLD